MPEIKKMVLKISGEALARDSQEYHRKALAHIATELESVLEEYWVALIVGGGNLVRGENLKDQVLASDSLAADYIGMTMTLANAMALQEFLEAELQTKIPILSRFGTNPLCAEYTIGSVRNCTKDNPITIIAGGIGKPGFSTDMALPQVSVHIEADVVLKGTKVNGVYNVDPLENPNAVMFAKISHNEYLQRKLKVVNYNAISVLNVFEKNLRVFNIFQPGNLAEALHGRVGTLIESYHTKGR